MKNSTKTYLALIFANIILTSGCVSASSTDDKSHGKRYTLQTIAGDILISDQTTGLSWTNSQQGCKPLLDGDPATVAKLATNFCNSLSFGGFNDWRLSTVAESQTLEIETDKHDIALFYKNPQCPRVLASNGTNSVTAITTTNTAPAGKVVGHSLPAGIRCVRKQ